MSCHHIDLAWDCRACCLCKDPTSGCWMQGPFSIAHMKALQQAGTVQDDTLVMAAAKGPSLLRTVLDMCEAHRASPVAG